MGAAATIFAVAIGLSLAMSAAWFAVIRGAKSGWVDATWSFLVGIAGVVVSLAPIQGWEGEPWRKTTVAVAALLWSVRLGSHIVTRTRSGGDDPRYVALKSEWGANWQGRMFWFLQIQAAVALLLAVTIFLAARNPVPGMQWSDLAGLALLLIAVAGEGIADAQLSQFTRNTRNKRAVCDAGLWGLSRHPNYFFQWLGWLGYAIISIGPNGAWPWGWLAIGGPLMMYWLLTRASGIPPLEAHMMKTRGSAYAKYRRRVNAFWPGAQSREISP